MKKIQTVAFAVVTIFILVSCSLFTPKESQNDEKLGNFNLNVADIPALDLEGPLPSPGAALLKALAVDEPGVAALVDDVEISERAALQAAIEILQAQLPPTSYTQNLASADGSQFETSSAVPPAVKGFLAKPAMIPVVYNPPATVRSAEGGLSPASMIGLLSSMFTDIFSLPVAYPTKSFTKTEKEGDVTSNMSMELGKSEDGSSHFGLGLQSEGTKNGTSVKTDMSAVIDGQRCPTAEGQVSFSIKARIGSESGGTGTTQDLTTFVRAVVNDDAEIASSTFDLIQGTRSLRAGVRSTWRQGRPLSIGQDYLTD